MSKGTDSVAGEASRRRRSKLRRWILAAVGVLYVLSVPWYRPETELRLIFGLPDWVAVAFGCYFLVACLNSWAWLWTEVDDEAPLAPVFDPEDGPGETRS